MLQRELKETGDGSHTIFIPEWGEHYHSFHGALQESEYIFIGKGLKEVAPREGKLHILEMGFGTGLNALLSLQYAEEAEIPLQYTSLEAYPVNAEEAAMLNYTKMPGYEKYTDAFHKMHTCDWDSWCTLSTHFQLLKIAAKLQDHQPAEIYDVVFWDAFAPDKQPELWSEETFAKIANAMSPGAILVTYSAKSQVRRNMIAAGLEVEKLPGPPHKREMLRARKP